MITVPNSLSTFTAATCLPCSLGAPAWYGLRTPIGASGKCCWYWGTANISGSELMSISASPGQNILFGPVISSAGLYVSGITGGSALGQVKAKSTILHDTSYLARMKALFGSALIAYYVGGESSDTIAIDDSGNGYHGTYTGVTLGQTGAGDGRTCPLYDGVGDYMQPPAGFRNAFNGAEGAASIWLKVFSASVWTDATVRVMLSVRVDAANLVNIFRTAVNNQINFSYNAGGVAKAVLLTISDTGWNHFGLTWSLSAPPTGEMKAYLNGVQVGTTQTGLGTWVGTPIETHTLLGAFVNIPTNVFSGYEAHALFTNRAATPAEMAAAAVI